MLKSTDSGLPAAVQIADIWSCGVMVYVMLVGAYPFERPEDKHDNQKLQKMIQVRSCSTAPSCNVLSLAVDFTISSCCIKVCLFHNPWTCLA